MTQLLNTKFVYVDTFAIHHEMKYHFSKDWFIYSFSNTNRFIEKFAAESLCILYKKIQLLILIKSSSYGISISILTFKVVMMGIIFSQYQPHTQILYQENKWYIP